jgi:predicted transcriptional regulator
MDDVTIMKNKAKEYLDNADEKTIKMIYAMLEIDAQSDWWDDLPESAKESINRGLKDVENGKVTNHKEVIKKYEKWQS